MRHKLPIILLFFCILTGCEKLALLTTSKKTAVTSQTHLSSAADKKFWETLHGGHYADIPDAEKLMMAAYLENPNNPQLAAHLGFLHIWKITERERSRAIADNPNIVNEIILARKYFEDAVALYPEDARFQGFLGDSLLIEGKIFHDPHEEIRGYFQLKRAIAQWPEFNYFTAGYPMSSLEPSSKQFQEGLEWQWETLNLCAGEKVNRQDPNYAPYLARETQQGRLRACWNSWIAPHNFEGFFLNMGDMLVKQGDWQTAIKIYKNAQLSKHYATWPYRDMLEYRIRHAKENVVYFQAPPHPSDLNKTILFNSGAGCVACHQN